MTRHVLTVDLVPDRRRIAKYLRFHRERAAMAAHRASHPRCAEWEDLMRTFQSRPPGARPGEMWARMEKVFRLRGSKRARKAR